MVVVEESGVGKRKRGRPPRAGGAAKSARTPPKARNEEEDVCFICFDGGSLVLCDRRGCPKAYHPACIKRDEAFFRSTAKWNCGWHICSSCQKASHYLCYTCTFSLCKGCIKNADYLCVRGNKGFCTTCLKTIMLIENIEQENKETAQVDFDDKSSWEYLFKVYWIYLKEKLSLTSNELISAKNPWKGAGTRVCKEEQIDLHCGVSDAKDSILTRPPECLEVNSQKRIKTNKHPEYLNKDYQSTDKSDSGKGTIDVHYGVNDGNDPNSARPPECLEVNSPKRRKIDAHPEYLNKDSQSIDKSGSRKGTTSIELTEWATKELLEFVGFMKNGDTSVLSHFDVQSLLLAYIKRKNLRDPRQKSQIICDSRLKNLFGKPRVGHFEMLKLLEFHFLIKEECQKGPLHGSIIDAVPGPGNGDGNDDNVLIMGRDKRRKYRKKVEERGPQTNLDEYAAIDVHNINLIYLRRSLMESLYVDTESFSDKAVGSIVRIRISGSDQKQDMYRLVQVAGTSKGAVPYNIGKKTADVMLEILNLDKKEAVSIDAISNQEFSEDECRRLRQSIKCGLVKRFTVGDIQQKAMALQAVRLSDWLETEMVRLNHLRDRASEKGRKKELRECVEKLQLLKTPEERQRRLREIPEIHADPHMNPSYESEDDVGELNNDHVRSKHSGFTRKGKEPNALRKGGDYSNGSRGKGPQNSITRKQSKNMSGTVYPVKVEDMKSDGLGKPGNRVDSISSAVGSCNNQASLRLKSSGDMSESSTAPLSIEVAPSIDSEMEKLWHYRDPNGKVQGPFCMVQLRKWSTTGYFPPDMRIWGLNDKQDDSIFLTDLLNGQFHKEISTSCPDQPEVDNQLLSLTCSGNPPNQVKRDPHGIPAFQTGDSSSSVASVATPTDTAEQNRETDIPDLPSPTPTDAVEQNHEVHILDLPSPTPKTTTNGDFEGQVAENKQIGVTNQDSHIVDLPSPTPVPENQEKRIQPAENRSSMSSNSHFLDSSGLSWSSAANLIVGSQAQIPEIADERGDGSSPTPAKTLVAISSLILPEVLADQAATQISNNDQITHSYSEPIEIDALAEESVSDLLAEVDAMESQCGLTSPTSKMNCFGEDSIDGSKNDFFGSMEGWSPTHELGKSDALSSTMDLHLHSQSTLTDECLRESQADGMDTLRRSGEQSSTTSEVEGETKSSNIPVNHRDAGSHIQDMVDMDSTSRAGSEAVDPGCRRVHELHLGLGGLAQGITNTQDMDTTSQAGSEVVDPDCRQAHEPHLGSGGPAQGIKNTQDVANMDTTSLAGSEVVDPGCRRVHEPHLGLGGPAQGIANTQGMHPTSQAVVDPGCRRVHEPHLGSGGPAQEITNLGWESQHKHSRERFMGPRERTFLAVNSGFNRGKYMWNWQSSLGGGGNPRPFREQRVCKFYESGHCKKGASCDYLHP